MSKINFKLETQDPVLLQNDVESDTRNVVTSEI